MSPQIRPQSIGLCLIAALVVAGCSNKADSPKTPPKTTPKDTKTAKKTPPKDTKPKLKLPPKETPKPKVFDPKTVPQTKYTMQRVVLPTKDQPMTIIGNAYLSEGRAVKLQWMEDPKSFSLRESYNAKAKVTGKIKLKREERLAYENARMIIPKPRPFVAKKDLELKPHGPTFHKLDESKHMGLGEQIDALKIKKGETLNLYHFFPSGSCLIGVVDGEKKTTYYRAACPDPGDFSCEHVPRDYASAPLKPLERQWWFEVKKDKTKGWLQVDKTMIIPHLKRLDMKTGMFQVSKPPPAPKAGIGTNTIPNGPKTSPNNPPLKGKDGKTPGDTSK